MLLKHFFYDILIREVGVTMFETEINEELENKEIQKEIIEYYLMNKKPKSSFKEIFATLKKEQQENIYDCYELFKRKRNVTELQKNILEFLQEYFTNMTSFHLHIFDEIKEKGYSKEYDISLILAGILFSYKENGEIRFTVCEEVMDLFLKNIQEKERKNIIEQSVSGLVVMLLKTYGIVSLDLLKYYLDNIYYIKISKQSIDSYLSFLKCSFLSYNNQKYFFEEHLKPSDNLSFLDNKNPVILTREQLENYFFKVINFLNAIADVSPKLKIEKVYDYLLNHVFLKPFEVIETANEMEEKFKLKPSETTSLATIFLESSSWLRYFVFEGRTEGEKEALGYVVKQKPTKNTLCSFLKGLPKSSLETLKDYYSVEDLEDLRDAILEAFQEEVYEYFSSYDEFLNNLNKNNQEYKNDIAVGLITSGYFFLYKQNNRLYIGVPKEIIYLKKKISENDMVWLDDESLSYDDIFDENEALPF